MTYRLFLLLSILSGQYWVSLIVIGIYGVRSWEKKERQLGSQLPELIYSAFSAHFLALGNQT